MGPDGTADMLNNSPQWAVTISALLSGVNEADDLAYCRDMEGDRGALGTEGSYWRCEWKQKGCASALGSLGVTVSPRN